MPVELWVNLRVITVAILKVTVAYREIVYASRHYRSAKSLGFSQASVRRPVSFLIPSKVWNLFKEKRGLSVPRRSGRPIRATASVIVKRVRIRKKTEANGSARKMAEKHLVSKTAQSRLPGAPMG